MNSLRGFDIKFIKGIGPVKAELLHKELGLDTAYDLLHHYPTHYADRTGIYSIRDLNGDMASVQLRGHFVGFSIAGEGAKTRLIGVFTDGTGSIEIVWFKSIKNIRRSLTVGTEYVIFGKPSSVNDGLYGLE